MARVARVPHEVRWRQGNHEPSQRCCPRARRARSRAWTGFRAGAGDGPDIRGTFGPAVRALDPKDVVDVAAALGEMDPTAMLVALPLDDREATVALGTSMQGFVGDPRAYLVEHVQRLRVFYERAAQRGMFVAIWWD